MAEAMQITERTVGDVTILALAGQLVLDDGDIVLREHVNRLVDQGRVRLVLDMRGVTRLDSAGIGMLVSKYVTTSRRGGSLKLIHLTLRSDHLMQITHLNTVLEMYESEVEAMRSFGLAPVVPRGAS